MAEIHGHCDEGFSRVRDAFTENFEQRGDVGAAVSVYIDGEPVVDLWGGMADLKRDYAWERDTLVNVYSTTKGFTALCAHILADRGELDFDEPVATYWPEFAQAGKERIPVRWVMSHQDGLAAISEPLPSEAIGDWDRLTSALAAQAPLWEPGTAHGYHPFTWGYLVGEVVRRISGRSLGTFLREEIAEPLGLDFHVGLDEREDEQVARIIPAKVSLVPSKDKDEDETGGVPSAASAVRASELSRRAFNNPPQPSNNGRLWRRAEIPAANGHGTARSIARMYGALARGGEIDGARVVSPAQIDRMREEQVSGPDMVLGIENRFGMGYCLPGPMLWGAGPNSLGHGGAGGSLGFADVDRRLGFGYVMNQLGSAVAGSNTSSALVSAVYESFEG